MSELFLSSPTIKRATEAINVFYCIWNARWVGFVLWYGYTNNINTDKVVYGYVDM